MGLSRQGDGRESRPGLSKWGLPLKAYKSPKNKGGMRDDNFTGLCEL